VPSTRAYRLSSGARSDIGPRRSDNQDSGYASDRLLLVADGVGGAPAGHLASSLVVESLVTGLEPLVQPNAGQIRDEVIRANAALARAGREDSDARGMATTVTGLVMTDDIGYLVHVGDSRAYRCRDGVFEQLTVDQSWVQMLLDEGMLDPADASTHPMRNMLMHSLSGALRDPEAVHITPIDLQIGDRWLLATDGLTSYLPRDVISSQVTSVSAPQELANILVDLCWPHSLDNITVLIGDVIDSEAKQQSQFVGAVQGYELRRSRVS